ILGIYKINNCDTGSSDDIIIRAMQRAKADGMQIINLSIGHEFAAWSEDPLAVATSAIADSGIAVVISISNDGNSGIFTLGSPESGANVITVGAIENFKFFTFFLSLSTDPSRKIIYATTRITLQFGLSGPLPIKPTSNVPLTADDVCNSVTGSFTGSIALIARGGCSFNQKVTNAVNAGAVGVIFYNNDATQSFAISVTSTTPTAIISMNDGLFILNEINRNPSVTVSFPNNTIVADSQIGGQPLNSSGLGPTFELDLKPDFLAPGGRIFSTFPIALGSYATLSGTSMAAAYMSGSVALFLQAKGTTDPKRVRDIFQVTSKPLEMKDLNQKSLGMLHSVSKQGGGVINVLDAIESKVLITPGRLALNDTPHFNGTAFFQITNNLKDTANFVISHRPAASARGFFGGQLVPLAFTFFEKFFATVKIEPSSIRLKPGKSTTIKLSITPPVQLDPQDFGIYSGFIVVKIDGNGHDGNGHDGNGHDGNDHDGNDHDGNDHDGNGHDGNGHDKNGHDKNGHDRNGHDRNGHDRNGHDRNGHDRNGL
ncbi:17011_t:CDS:2, partial [Cetraspora pellucida]